jgi:hypothetical protein
LGIVATFTSHHGGFEMGKLRTAILAAAIAAVPLAAVTSARATEPQRQGVVLYNAAGVPVAILTPLRDAPSDLAPAAIEVPSANPALQMLREIEAASAMPAPFGDPFMQMMAEQDAIMRQMAERMRAMGPDMFGANGTVTVAMPSLPPGANQVVVTTMSSGRGSCSQTVTYSYPGSGAQPQVAVRQVGDACGAIGAPTNRTVPAAESVAPERPDVAGPQPVPPTSQPSGRRTYDIDWRHPAQTAPREYRG